MIYIHWRKTHLDFAEHLFSDVDDLAERHFALYSLLGDSLLSSARRTATNKGSKHLSVFTYAERNPTWAERILQFAVEPQEVLESPVYKIPPPDNINTDEQICNGVHISERVDLVFALI